MESLAFRLVLIYASYAYLIFILGFTGHCTRVWVGASLVWPVLWLGLTAFKEKSLWKSIRAHGALGIALLALTLAYTHALWVPPFARDDMIYHLLVPKQMAMTGKLAFDPFNVNSNFPLLFEMPLAAWEALGRPLSPFTVNIGFALLLTAVVYAALVRHAGLGKTPAAWVSAAFAATPVLFGLTHTCYVEIFFALLIVLAALFYFRRLENPGAADWLRTCACLGLAAAVKYPGLIFALMFFAFEFFRTRDRKTFYAGLLLCAALASPWYVRNWIQAGNPVFPFLNTLFASPWISPTRFEGFHRMLADYHMGHSPSDWILLPFRLALGIDSPGPGYLGFDGKLSLLFAAALLGLGFKDKKQLFASLVFVLYFGIWALESQQVRFLLPILPVGLVFAARRLASLPHAARWAGWAATAVLIQNGFNVMTALRGEGIAALISGKTDKAAFLSAHMPISHPLAAEINRRLDPKRDRLMTVGTFGRNYPFDVPVLSNTYYDQEIFRNAFERGNAQYDSVTAFLGHNRVTHILFNWNFVRQMHARDTAFDLEALEGYFRNTCESAEAGAGLSIYRRR